MTAIIKDIPFNYEEYGIGKPVLCIHGYLVDHRMMKNCFEPVFKSLKGYRRIYIDLPGMGRTPAANYIKTAYDTLELLIKFINQIIPNENVLLAGESFGGHLSLGLINKIPDKIDGVFLLCPHIDSLIYKKESTLPKKRSLFVSDILQRRKNDPDIKKLLDTAVIATPKILRDYKTSILKGIKVCDKRFLFKHFSGDFSLKLKEDLKGVKFDKPMCILTGRQDHIVGFNDAYELLNLFPRASYSVIDYAGHNLQIENVKIFSVFVRDWIKRIEMEMNRNV